MPPRSVAAALSKLRNERLGRATAAEQYEVEDENDKIFQVISDGEYEQLNKSRKINKFVEDADSADEEEEDYYYDYNELENEDLATSQPQIMKPLVQHFVEMAKKGPTQKNELEAFDIEKYHAMELELDDDLPKQTVARAEKIRKTVSIKEAFEKSRRSSIEAEVKENIYEPVQPEQPEVEEMIPEDKKVENRTIDKNLYGVSAEEPTPDFQDFDQEYEIYDEIPESELDYPKTEAETRTADQGASAYMLEGNNIGVYCLDIQEDQKGNIYIFGKVITAPYNKDNVDTGSCSILVTDFMRDLYFKVRMDLEFKNMGTAIDSQNILYQKMVMKSFYSELQEIKNHYGIQKIKFKLVWRKILQNGPSAQEMFIKVCYPYSSPDIGPIHYSGKCYSEVYGLNSSIVERFIVKRKIKGPCWLLIKDVKSISEAVSYCQFEYMTKGHKSVCRWNYNDKEFNLPEPPSPKFCICGISVKMASLNTPEALQISMIYNKSAKIDGFKYELSNENQFIFIRKLPKKNWPPGLESFCKNRPYINLFDNERNMIALFFTKLQQIDPDILVSHDINNNVIENLVKRAVAIGLTQRISFSRLKYGRKVLHRPYYIGRIIADTRILNKEFNPGQLNYDLESLVKFDKWKPNENFSRVSFTLEDVDVFFSSLNSILGFIQSSSKFAYYCLNSLLALQALALTRELTCTAGNLWCHSLLCMRSNRNDMLLFHEFHRLKYILSNYFQKQYESKRTSYEGGLVLDPILGLYDTFVLLLDFNALYPSIIQEFNVCFTTAVVTNTDGNPTVDKILPETGVLPGILKRLVEMRYTIKSAMSSEKNHQKYAQLHVKQLALKLIANSLYGCLGSPYSRFYAQHLAAFITLQGRTILMDTKDRMEGEFRLQVIYGDTDSVMINTNIRHDGNIESYNKTIQLASILTSTINKKYRKLEIEVDAVFARLVLLRKKKYAALRVVNYAEKKLEIESKGLDFIRRDWSILTKEVGDKILSILFTMNFGDSGIDAATEKIHELLTFLCSEMDNGKIPLESYAITKRLTRNPSEYSDPSALPHVSVALRINEQGKRIVRAGQEISYIICSKDSINQVFGGESTLNTLSQRAFGVDEVKTLNLKPDLEYYKSVQILPPVIRLCSSIEGTSIQRLGRCMGLTLSESYESRVSDESQNSYAFERNVECTALNLIKTSIENYRGISLAVGLKCDRCGNTSQPDYFLQYLKCSHCRVWLPINSVRNWLQRVIFELDTNSAICTRKCANCEVTTQRVKIGATTQCPQMTCQSYDSMEQFLTPNKTFLYYDYLGYLLSSQPEQVDGKEESYLVPILLDPLGRVHPLDESPIQGINISDYDELLTTLSKDQSIAASSGLKKMCPAITSFLINAACLKFYVLDYKQERRNLFSLVRKQQSKNGYSQIRLSSLFTILKTA